MATAGREFVIPTAWGEGKNKSFAEMGDKTLYDLGLTLIHPFWGEVERFKKLFEHWKGYSSRVKDVLKIVVIDDCGDPPMHTLMTRNRTKYTDFNLSIYRITDDLLRNTPGALNLGVMVAQTPWVLIMDSDCIFNNENMERLLELPVLHNWIYKFRRKRETEDAHLAKNNRYLPCTILMAKDAFLDVNGFDEDFTGEYTGGWAFFDTHFDHKLATRYETIDKQYRCGIVGGVIATEYMKDYVEPPLPRTREEEIINRRLCRAKQNKRVPESKHMLRYSWQRTYHNRRGVQ